MWQDPIVKEVRKSGEDLAKMTHYNLQDMLKNLRDNERKAKVKVVSGLKEKKPRKAGSVLFGLSVSKPAYVIQLSAVFYQPEDASDEIVNRFTSLPARRPFAFYVWQRLLRSRQQRGHVRCRRRHYAREAYRQGHFT